MTSYKKSKEGVVLDLYKRCCQLHEVFRGTRQRTHCGNKTYKSYKSYLTAVC